MATEQKEQIMVWKFESVYWNRQDAEARAEFLRSYSLVVARGLEVQVVEAGQHFEVQVGSADAQNLRGWM